MTTKVRVITSIGEPLLRFERVRSAARTVERIMTGCLALRKQNRWLQAE